MEEQQQQPSAQHTARVAQGCAPRLAAVPRHLLQEHRSAFTCAMAWRAGCSACSPAGSPSPKAPHVPCRMALCCAAASRSPAVGRPAACCCLQCKKQSVRGGGERVRMALRAEPDGWRRHRRRHRGQKCLQIQPKAHRSPMGGRRAVPGDSSWHRERSWGSASQTVPQCFSCLFCSLAFPPLLGAGKRTGNAFFFYPFPFSF